LSGPPAKAHGGSSPRSGSVTPPCSPVTPCCFVPPRHCSKTYTDRHPKAARKLRTYANVGLLCIDEVGYLSFDDKAADLLYEVVNRRYERKPVILTTNRPFKEWNEVFPNATCIVTLPDRLLQPAEVTVVEGDSYPFFVLLFSSWSESLSEPQRA
jgi:IstB-like ATP binding protein